MPFGLTHSEDIVRPRERQLRKGIAFVESAIDRVDIAAQEVHLDDGACLGYDVLIIATGARLVPEETDGLTGPGWMDNVFTFYTPEGAAALGAALETFDRGRLVVNVVDMPIKCPVAPLEFCFLADWYFTERRIRDQVDITYATPLDGAFTKPIAAEHLGGMLAERGIELVTEFNTGEVDGAGGRLVGYDGREVPFDLAVVIPLHGGAAYVGRSPGLGDELDFVPTDEHTLQAKAAPNIFVIGDAANVPCLQSRVGHPLRRRDPRRQRPAVPRRRTTRSRLRRARQLLHRDRVPQGPAHRLQLRHRTPPRALPDHGRAAAAQGVPPQPPRQAAVPVRLLAQPAPRPRPPRPRLHHAHRRQTTTSHHED